MEPCPSFSPLLPVWNTGAHPLTWVISPAGPQEGPHPPPCTPARLAPPLSDPRKQALLATQSGGGIEPPEALHLPPNSVLTFRVKEQS